MSIYRILEWSPDRQWLYFIGRTSDQYNLYRIDDTGKKLEKLPRGGHFDNVDLH